MGYEQVFAFVRGSALPDAVGRSDGARGQGGANCQDGGSDGGERDEEGGAHGCWCVSLVGGRKAGQEVYDIRTW